MGFLLLLAVCLVFRFVLEYAEEVADTVLGWLWTMYQVWRAYFLEKVDWLSVGVRTAANLAAGAAVYALVHAH